jgi:hypothetical protein
MRLSAPSYRCAFLSKLRLLLFQDDAVISLLGPLATPLAASVGAVAGEAASAVTTPFASFLGAAQNDAAIDGSDETSSLEEDVTARLQKIFTSVGVPAGERVTLHIDKQTGAIHINGDQPLAADLEAALRGDKKLASGLGRLAKVKDIFHSSPLIADSEVEAAVTEDGSVALHWL